MVKYSDKQWSDGLELTVAGDEFSKETIGTVQITLAKYKKERGDSKYVIPAQWFVTLMDFHGMRFAVVGVWDSQEEASQRYIDVVNLVRLEALPEDMWNSNYGQSIPHKITGPTPK